MSMYKSITVSEITISEEFLNLSSLVQLAALQHKLQCMWMRGDKRAIDAHDKVTKEIQWRFSNMRKTDYTEEEHRAIQSIVGY